MHFFQKLLVALTSAGNWMTILSSIETESCVNKIHSGCVGTLWICILYMYIAYMQKTCDVAEKAILAKKKLRKKGVNRDKM